MRNLKRALSLALASVMLLGMMVVGTSAASANDFTDADAIDNKEAVAIATGLGIFDGYTDGSFGPDKVVTRAEMAVVIAKILHGADVDPSNFAGAGKFTDVPAWAEGYVNLVASLGIIEGYGNGKFGPNDTVTTVQATTMLLKALGYFVDDETALGADWQLTVTSKATALGLYGDLTLGMNAGLTREDVAALTFNALFAQRVAYDDYRGLYVKANDRNVVVTNGTNDDLNTLADNTFGLYAVEGTVVANGMTDESLSKTLKSEAQTTIVFDEDTDLNQDGKVEYAEGDDYSFEVETGLDMIGHSAKVYYKLVKKAPVVFAIVDQATLVATIDHHTNDTILAENANEAGFKKNSILDITEDKYVVNYDMETLYTGDAANFDLDTLVVISNSGDYEVDCVIALDQYLDKIDMIDDDNKDDIDYELVTGVAKKLYAPMGAVAEGDYVIVTDIGNKNDVLVFETAEVVSADITKLSGSATDHSIINAIVADGETYYKSDVFSNGDESVYTYQESAYTVVDQKGALDLVTDFSDIATIGTVNLIMDKFGYVIALAGEKTVPNYAYVAQYGFKDDDSALNTDTEGALAAHVYFADGTNGIYLVDTTKSDVTFADNKGDLNGTGDAIYWADGGQRGLYNVKVLANGKVDIDAIASKDVSASVQHGTKKLIKAHSTILDGTANVTAPIVVDGQSKNHVLYNNNDTVYFYVTGCYTDFVNGKTANTLKVDVITGIKNVINVTNDVTPGSDDTISHPQSVGDVGMKEAYATALKAGKVETYRAAIDTMLIQGVRAEGTDVYYYDRDYTYAAVEGGYDVTFTVYSNKTGEATTVTYDNNGKPFETVADAKAYADSKNNGFYTLGATELKEYAMGYTIDEDPVNNYVDLKDKVTYVVNDEAKYDEYVDNLYSANVKIGSITEEDTIIVDLCNSGLTSITKIARAIKDGGQNSHVYISYSYNDKYETAVLFVTSYLPDEIEAPGAGTSTNVTIKETKLEAQGNNAMKATITLDKNVGGQASFQLQYSTDNGATWYNTGVAVKRDFSGATATATFTAAASTNGLLYRAIVDSVDGLHYGSGDNSTAVVISGAVSNGVLNY